MKTIAQQLNIKDFPFRINNSKGNLIYYETSKGYWWKTELDSNDREIYSENYNGFWCKREYDSNDNLIYFEDSNGYWFKREYDINGNQIYFEDSKGLIKDKRSKEVILTLDEIAKKFNIDVKDLKVKK